MAESGRSRNKQDDLRIWSWTPESLTEKDLARIPKLQNVFFFLVEIKMKVCTMITNLFYILSSGV